MKKTGIVFGLSIVLASCQAIKSASNPVPSDKVLYEKAIATAIYPFGSQIDSNLVDINAQNPNLVWKTIDDEKYILVVSWKSASSADSYYKPAINKVFNTQAYPIWVTTAPQLQSWFKQQNVADTNLRLKQLLGLPPNSSYSYFVEFWVKPADLFRPCPDAEITDKTCSLVFPADADPAHKEFINENRISRYYQPELYSQYPWSQLGYTFDWNPGNPTHFGMSEFVIPANTNIYVNAVYTTTEYLK